MATADAAQPSSRAAGATLVLLTLAAGQFLMTLDSSVMNVSIATVAKDVGTTVTGIQGAITAYTLVMAALMIPGQMTVIPVFILLRNLKLIDSLPSLWLPSLRS